MLYRDIKPQPQLEPYIKCFWLMERDYRAPGAEEVVWPDGKTELLFLAVFPGACLHLPGPDSACRGTGRAERGLGPSPGAAVP